MTIIHTNKHSHLVPLPLLLCPRTLMSCNSIFLSRLPLAKSVLFQAIVPTRLSCPAISRTNLHCAASQINILPESIIITEENHLSSKDRHINNGPPLIGSTENSQQ